MSNSALSRSKANLGLSRIGLRLAAGLVAYSPSWKRLEFSTATHFLALFGFRAGRVLTESGFPDQG
jgi:hypothetical protein